jgi:hypothetical protein
VTGGSVWVVCRLVGEAVLEDVLADDLLVAGVLVDDVVVDDLLVAGVLTAELAWSAGS